MPKRSHSAQSPVQTRRKGASEIATTVDLLGLPNRQAQIVKQVLEGKSDKQIAYALGLSRHTVRTHLNRVFIRLGVTDRISLVVHVFDRQLLGCRHPKCPYK